MKNKAWIGRTDDSIEQSIRDGLDFIGWKDIIQKNARVFVKPNLTYPHFKPGATTSPAFMDAAIGILRERTPNIAVGESDGGNNSYSADVPFEGHDLPAITAKHGVELLNLSKDSWRRIPVKGGLITRHIPISERLLDTFDVTVNIPVPKMHFVVGYTGAIKNHWGLIPDTMRLRNHHFFSHAILEIIRRVSPEIVIADGTYFMDRNGPIRGDALEMNLAVVANSPGTADVVLNRVMNIDPQSFIYLKHAIKQGFAPASLDDIELNADPWDFHCVDFHLERSPMDWFATAGFYSKWMTKIVYDSPLDKPIHSFIRKFRKKSDVKAATPETDIRRTECVE